MWQSWMIIADYHRRQMYCEPDRFNMYIYSDWYGYGLQELLGNLVSLRTRHAGTVWCWAEC